ncbi:DUF3696 domain-containing protein (plasmid) [Chryseobacterium panacisoli]|uniref:DUF3696 domain-containing protein n=1 Tax=Chryseobacterium panacisoli TaxID=1807141 RepID=A0A5D8ZYC6_9FLAO|nr:DUF3696 domain-containing protein [Chryseobacterium panacisoli]TZF99263.1 DUF3696 domain-containing protein [Chryseobacterium panacisoli]
MIKSIVLSGFKSFLENYIEFGNLTLLTGLNSSGKSSIIQSLLMLEKAYYEKNNILLENHGNVKELKNPNQQGSISFTIEDSNTRNIIEIDDNDNYKLIGEKIIDFPQILYISANRFGPTSIIPIYNNSSIKNKVGKNGENLIQFIDFYADYILNESLRHSNAEGNTLLFNIKAWLSIISPNVKFDYKLDNRSDSSYTLFNNHRSTNVGFGLSYSLSVIATLLIGSLLKNCLIIIENPEAHLHPRGQAELARLISLCANLDNQIIIETHSDHIFDNIRICSKEFPDFYDKVRLHWLELNEFNNTKISSPNLDKDGKLDNWPTGLFDQFEINASKLF